MAEVRYRRRLIIFAKAPELGRVKTRLAREVGFAEATRWYRSNLSALVRRLAHDPRWDSYLAASPDRSTWPWPLNVDRVPQGGGDMGTRMSRAFRRVPPGAAVLIGGDVPNVEARHIEEAFRRLGSHDAVFGPTPDGGYWLVGLRRLTRAVDPFTGVRWSGPHALDDTRRNLNGLNVAFVDVLRDVDTAADLP